MRAVLGVFPQSDRVVFVSALKSCRAEEKNILWWLGCFFPFFSFFFSFIRFGDLVFTLAFLWVIFLFFKPFKSIFRCRLVSCLRTSSLHAFLCLNHSKIGVVTAVLYKMFEYWGPVFSGFGTYIHSALLVQTFFVYIYTLHRPPSSSI